MYGSVQGTDTVRIPRIRFRNNAGKTILAQDKYQKKIVPLKNENILNIVKSPMKVRSAAPKGHRSQQCCGFKYIEFGSGS